MSRQKLKIRLAIKSNLMLVLLFLSACTSYQSTNKNSFEDFSIPPISIFNIEEYLIDTTYIITGFTRSSVIWKISDFVYEITLSINVNGVNTWWDSPFEVVLILPNGEIEYYLLNEEETTLSSYFIEDFKLIAEIPKKGRAKCALSLLDHQADEFQLADYDWWFLNLY